MPSSACPLWQTDKPASPAGERNDQPRSYAASLQMPSNLDACIAATDIEVSRLAGGLGEEAAGAYQIAEVNVILEAGTLYVNSKAVDQSYNADILSWPSLSVSTYTAIT